MAVSIAARICHDYQQGPGADTKDSGGVPTQACFLPRAGFMWLSFGAVQGGASGCWSGVATRRL